MNHSNQIREYQDHGRRHPSARRGIARLAGVLVGSASPQAGHPAGRRAPRRSMAPQEWEARCESAAWREARSEVTMIDTRRDRDAEPTESRRLPDLDTCSAPHATADATLRPGESRICAGICAEATFRTLYAGGDRHLSASGVCQQQQIIAAPTPDQGSAASSAPHHRRLVQYWRRCWSGSTCVRARHRRASPVTDRQRAADYRVCAVRRDSAGPRICARGCAKPRTLLDLIRSGEVDARAGGPLGHDLLRITNADRFYHAHRQDGRGRRHPAGQRPHRPLRTTCSRRSSASGCEISGSQIQQFILQTDVFAVRPAQPSCRRRAWCSRL